jgi:flagellar protein FlaG
MDVNTITNGVKSINIYNNPSDSQASVATDDIKASSILKDERDQENKNSSPNSPMDKKELHKSIAKLNKILGDEGTHAEYSVYKELGTTMVKIIDDDSKKVILELPSEKILDMIASMCEKAGLIDKKV